MSHEMVYLKILFEKVEVANPLRSLSFQVRFSSTSSEQNMLSSFGNKACRDGSSWCPSGTSGISLDF
ncbi:hypothetical protein BT93_L0286 [Corymbia citriodora subsp. variegata]|uniref:Uncharacterized protein n=1 Tax=Corymbia citriodora subsp. variegata TaxID=360336 RepID=A0A8T0CRF8_CORYI|nr:hypothetical protein BT93_L0286 [Corymbia citriodora subsp. variegata]